MQQLPEQLPMKQGACPPIGQFRHSRLSLVCAAALPCGCPCRASGASDEDVHGAVHHVDVGVGPGKHGAHILEAALRIFRGSWQIFSMSPGKRGAHVTRRPSSRAEIFQTNRMLCSEHVPCSHGGWFLRRPLQCWHEVVRVSNFRVLLCPSVPRPEFQHVGTKLCVCQISGHFCVPVCPDRNFNIEGGGRSNCFINGVCISV